MSGSRDRTPSDADANERTRLLANPDPEAQDVSKPSSLPVLSTFALCWARGIEIWIFYGIFPYLPAFVERTGVPKPKIGYYVGMVESVFAVAQFTAMMLWSSLSDKYGRKPVLVSCLFGASLSISAFGFSTEIWHMLVWRALAGVFAASAVTARIMVAESTPATHQPKAYSYLTMTSQLCVFLGPLVGGALYGSPAGFHWLPIRLSTMPALLPSLVNGIFVMGACIAVVLGVKETKPPTVDDGPEQIKPTYRSVLSSPGVLPVLILFLANWAYGNTASSVNPVFYYTDVSLGGWSFDTKQISYTLGSIGFCGSIYAVLIFPRLTARYGTRRLLKVGGCLQFLVYARPILSNRLLRRGWHTTFLVMLPPALALHAVLNISDAVSLQLSLNQSAPPGALGFLMSFSFSLGAVQKAILPASATALFAKSAEEQILGGHLIWYILLAWMLLYNAYLWRHAQWLPGKLDRKA